MPDVLRLTSLLVLFWLGAAGFAHAQQLSEFGPYLQVETGRHIATVNALAPLPGGAGVVSVSDDKTARVWSADTLAPQAVLRPPIGPADGGALYAVAVGHNLIAVGGTIPDGHRQFAVHFYCPPPQQRHCGSITGLAAVRALRFSPDGKYLAIGFQGGAGIFVYDMTTGTLQLADVHDSRGMTATPVVVIDSGYAGDVTWLDFDARNRLLVAADGRLRLYRTVHPANAGQALPLLAPGTLAVRSAVFSPDGGQIAAGDLHRDVVHVLDAVSLRQVTELRGAPGRQGALDIVAWSPTGRSLFAAGTYKDAAGNYLVRRWSVDGAPPIETAAAGNTVMALLPGGDGVIFASADPVIGRIDSAAHVIAIQHPQLIDFRNVGLALGISADGGVVELPGGPSLQRLRFDVRQRQIETAAPGSPDLAAPQDRGAGLVVSDWLNRRTPRVNGRPVELDPTETAHAVAVSPNGSGAVIGTDFYLRFEAPDGELWREPTAAPVWGVNISGDGKMILAALGDGTLRWYDVASHQERLGLFVDPTPRGDDGPRWVMWTPQGYFDHDHRSDGVADGRSLIGYLIDSTDWKSTKFVQIDQMYTSFFRPDLVDLSFRGQPDDLRQIMQQGEIHGNVEQIVSRGLPSAVTVLDICGHDPHSQASGCPPRGAGGDQTRDANQPGIDLTTPADAVLVQYRIDAREGGPGAAIIRRNGAVIRPDIFVDQESARSRTEEATIPLGAGTNDIQIVPVSASGDVQGTGTDIIGLKVQHTGATRETPAPHPGQQPAPQATPSVPTLYMLSVGISTYDQSVLNLGNAAHDAQAVAQLMDAPALPVYQHPVVKRLLNADATSANIIGALKDIAQHAKPDDLVIIFLAGHGQQVNGRYYFAPVEFGTHNPELFQRAVNVGNTTAEHAMDTLFEKEGLGQEKLLPLVQSISAAHVALILDTCFSAAIATGDAVLRRDLNSTVTNQIGNSVGRFVLSSSMNLALDTGSAGPADIPVDQQGHGLFTGYLLQALEGKADVTHSGRVDIDDVAKYTRRAVEHATASMPQPQQPTFYFNGNDFFPLRSVPGGGG